MGASRVSCWPSRLQLPVVAGPWPAPACQPACPALRGSRAIKPSCLQSPVPPDLPRRRRCCACLDRPFPSTQASRVEPLPPNFPALIRAESGGGVSLVWHDGDGGRWAGS